MKGMTCQISRDSWSDGLNPPQVILLLETQHQLRHINWTGAPEANENLPRSFRNMSAVIHVIINIQTFQPDFIFHAEALQKSLKRAQELHLGFIRQPNKQVGQSTVPDRNQCPAFPLPNQNKFNNYISLRRDNYSPMCQMSNFVCRTTKCKPQVLRDNPENQAELWPLPQNKHLSKQMDLVFRNI